MRHVDLDTLPADVREQIESLVRKYDDVPPRLLEAAEGRPSVVFTAESTKRREPGQMASMTNGLDTRGCTIVSQVGRAYLVESEGQKFIVHEPGDSWVPVED